MQRHHVCSGPRRVRIGKTVVFRIPGFGRVPCKIHTVLPCGVINGTDPKTKTPVDVYGYDFKTGIGKEIVTYA